MGFSVCVRDSGVLHSGGGEKDYTRVYYYCARQNVEVVVYGAINTVDPCQLENVQREHG